MSVAQFCTCLSFLARLKADCWTQDLTIKPKLTSHSACHYGGLLYVWVMKHQHHWQAWLQFPRKISTVKLIWSSRRTAFTVCFPLCVSVFPHVHFPSQYRTALTQWMLQWKVQDGTSVFENGWSGTNWSVCVSLCFSYSCRIFFSRPFGEHWPLRSLCCRVVILSGKMLWLSWWKLKKGEPGLQRHSCFCVCKCKSHILGISDLIRN